MHYLYIAPLLVIVTLVLAAIAVAGNWLICEIDRFTRRLPRI